MTKGIILPEPLNYILDRIEAKALTNFYGAPGTGKCVTGDTKILLGNFSSIPASKLFGNCISKSKNNKVSNCDELIAFGNFPSILTFEDGLKTAKITSVYTSIADVLKLKTKTGKTIKLTPNHPLLTLNENGIGWKRASELKIGDKIGFCSKITINERSKQFINLINLLDQKKVRALVKGKISKILVNEKNPSYEGFEGRKRDILKILDEKNRITSVELGKILNISKATARYYLRDLAKHKILNKIKPKRSEGLYNIYSLNRKIEFHNVRLEIIKRLLDEKKISYRDAEKDIKKIYWIKSEPIKPQWKISNDLLELLAYLMAEGSFGNSLLFSNENKLIIKRVSRLLEKLFSMEKPLKYEKGCTYYIKKSKTLRHFFSHVFKFSFHSKNKSKRLTINNFILKSSQKELAAFLRTFFECEGSISNTSVELSTASRDVAGKISLMLLRFGIIATISECMKSATNTKNRTRRKYYRICISNIDNLRLFSKNIGFLSKGKIKKLRKYIQKIPCMPHHTSRLPQAINKIIIDLFWKLRLPKKYNTAYKKAKFGQAPTIWKVKRVLKLCQKKLHTLETLRKELEEIMNEGKAKLEFIDKSRKEMMLLRKDIASELDWPEWKLNTRFEKKVPISISTIEKIVKILKKETNRILEDKDIEDKMSILKQLIKYKIGWDEIIERKNIGKSRVYDFTVPGTHNFLIANGVICHNTNICLLAVIECVKQGGKVIFIDTEGGFSLERLKQLTQNVKEVLEKITLVEPKSFAEQGKIIRSLDNKQTDLLILDSAVALYRLECADPKVEVLEANRELSKQLSILSNLAREKNIPVIITTHTFKNWDTGEDEIIGGDTIKYWSKCMVFIEHTGRMSERKATIAKHRWIAEGKSVKFLITQNGIKPPGFKLF